MAKATSKKTTPKKAAAKQSTPKATATEKVAAHEALTESETDTAEHVVPDPAAVAADKMRADAKAKAEAKAEAEAEVTPTPEAEAEAVTELVVEDAPMQLFRVRKGQVLCWPVRHFPLPAGSNHTEPGWDSYMRRHPELRVRGEAGYVVDLSCGIESVWCEGQVSRLEPAPDATEASPIESAAAEQDMKDAVLGIAAEDDA